MVQSVIPTELKPLYKSKEMLTGAAQAAAGIAGAGSTLFGAIGALHPAGQVSLVVLAGTLIAGGGFMAWNRVKAREVGDR
jgi:hypothetical protein